MALFSPKKQTEKKTWRDYLASVDLSSDKQGQVNMFELGKALGLIGGGLFGAFPDEKAKASSGADFSDAWIQQYGAPSSAQEHYDFSVAAERMGFPELAGYHYKKSFELAEKGNGGKPKTSSLATLSETAGNVEQVMGSMQTRANESDSWFDFTTDEFTDESRPKIEGAINLLTQTPGLEPIEQQALLQSGVKGTGGLFGTGLFEDLDFDYDTFLNNYNQFTQQKGLTRSSKQQPQQQTKPEPSYNPRSRLER
jgi:hypothetical protein